MKLNAKKNVQNLFHEFREKETECIIYRETFEEALLGMQRIGHEDCVYVDVSGVYFNYDIFKTRKWLGSIDYYVQSNLSSFMTPENGPNYSQYISFKNVIMITNF